MDEIERVEDLLHEPGARIGWGPHTQASSFDLLDDVYGERPAGQIARQALGALEVVRRDGLLAVNRESRVDPAQQAAGSLSQSGSAVTTAASTSVTVAPSNALAPESIS